jgi:hypothetical protein
LDAIPGQPSYRQPPLLDKPAVAPYAGNRKSQLIAACHYQQMGYELENM